MENRYYQKINTIFKRDERGRIIEHEYSTPEFEYLKECKFRAEEKIDGTNISIHFDGESVKFAGRRSHSEIPSQLACKLERLFNADKMRQVFQYPNLSVSLYGEGYGKGIQRGGHRYISNDVDFILFDVLVGNFWLSRANVEDVAAKLGIKVVPVVGYMTFNEAVDCVKQRFKSSIAEDPSYDAEGLVLKTDCGLIDRKGERIVAKIKSKDFKHLQASCI